MENGPVPELTAERLREVLHYDPETGIFTWKASSRRRGLTAGCPDSGGYLTIFVGTRRDGRLYPAHRLAWLYMTGKWPENMLDHINRVKSDNRWANLRPATRSQNTMNVGLKRNNTTGYKGVSRNRGKFLAAICVDGKAKTLGRFNTPEEAHAAYRLAAERLFGSFANPG